MQVGQEVTVDLEKGKTLFIKLKHISETNEQGTKDLFFEMNGSQRIVKVRDLKAGMAVAARPKADPRIKGSVGAPMPGVVIAVKVNVGDKVIVGEPLVILSAMKMETAVTSPISGVVKALHVIEGAQLTAGDLIVEVAA
jgi:pyruvate carboxylase